MKVLSVVNTKGGSGKSTSSIHIAHGLAKQGKRVLLIDLEPRGGGDVSKTFLLDSGNTLNISHVLFGRKTLDQCMVEVRPNLMVIPSTENLYELDYALENIKALKEQLKGRRDFDFAIIDCPGSFNNCVKSAIAASHVSIIPARCDGFDLDGLDTTVQYIHDFCKQHKIRQKSAIIPTMYRRHLTVRDDGMKSMKQKYGKHMLPTVRDTVEIPKAVAQNRTLFDNAPWHLATRDYTKVVNKIMSSV